ncbi:DoxX family protein [Stratiformator vulcanicus]|uniref:Oxidoreductase MhqP n=1 Tax=Stratiformator vulcanicus TaxID=2527980 RepID=A0A517R5A9_9PLAN|nr:DoxX family protein [Stratiformator vulcanicus]QDT39076.1 Putative oxidoreductase MhqP [Stratiformator vulcanicus]
MAAERRWNFFTDLGLLAIRGMVGWVMFFHGAQKLWGWFTETGEPGLEGFKGFLTKLEIPYPELNAYMAGGTEFFGGCLLMAGLMTRLVSIPVAITMGVAAFVAHSGTFSNQAGGMEYALTLMVVTIGILLTGPGRLSLDALLFRRKKRPTAD